MQVQIGERVEDVNGAVWTVAAIEATPSRYSHGEDRMVILKRTYLGTETEQTVTGLIGPHSAYRPCSRDAIVAAMCESDWPVF